VMSVPRLLLAFGGILVLATVIETERLVNRTGSSWFGLCSVSRAMRLNMSVDARRYSRSPTSVPVSIALWDICVMPSANRLGRQQR